MEQSAAEPLAFDVRPVAETDRAWVVKTVRGWGADFIISRGRKVSPQELPGFCAVAPAGERLGLATYEITGDACELVTLDALRQQVGVGTALLAAVREAAVRAGCRRLWLITTNDNLDALRFYQRRGMHLVAVHHGLRETARRLKPQIPLTGCFGIPIEDEIELEMLLGPAGPRPSETPPEEAGT
jgi:ribosomal protein S18 acetylase RimI-like enzyme